MKKTLLALQFVLFSHLLFAQVTPVPPKTTTVTTVKTIPADQALQIRNDSKKVRTELEKLSDSLALIQRDLNVLIESLKVKSDGNNAMSSADQKALQDLMTAMAAMQARFEEAAKMMKFVNDLRKSLQSKWP